MSYEKVKTIKVVYNKNDGYYISCISACNNVRPLMDEHWTHGKGKGLSKDDLEKQILATEEWEKQKAALQQKQQQAEQMAQMQQGSEVIKNVGGVDAFGGELMSRLGL